MTGLRHKIYARHQGLAPDRRLDISIIKRCVNLTLRLEGADKPCEVSVLITNDNSIQVINRKFRDVDKPTDVLSFPMQELVPGSFFVKESELDRQTGLLPLGDIIISAERVDKQAARFGHSRERETAYLVIHSVLHLLGYDHIDEAEMKRQMREREKLIAVKAGFPE